MDNMKIQTESKADKSDRKFEMKSGLK